MEHILVEHISGYELFELKEFEDLGTTSYSSYMAITQIVNHVSSLPFKDAAEVLSHLNVKDEIHPDLVGFFELNGVKTLHCDKIYKPLLPNIGIEYKSSPCIMRGVKENLKKLLKKDLNKQLTLSVAHSYSKDAIRYSLEKEDHLVIVVGNELDQLEKEIEALNKNILKLIDWHLPLLKKFIKEADYQSTLKTIFDKKENKGESKTNNDLIDTIIDEVITEMNHSDYNNLKLLNDAIIEKKETYERLKKYLEKKMKVVAPNLRLILGDRLTSKMLNKSAGLVNLGLYPASTLQLLGAEKSLFQSLKSNSRTPKHGALYEMDILKGNKGRMCRFIASKCSLAARIDAFNADRTDEYGRELRKLIEKKIKTGARGERTEAAMERVQQKIAKNSLPKEKPSLAPQKPLQEVAKNPRKRFDDMTEASKAKVAHKDDVKRIKESNSSGYKGRDNISKDYKGKNFKNNDQSFKNKSSTTNYNHEKPNKGSFSYDKQKTENNKDFSRKN